MTFQGHSAIASLFKWDFRFFVHYICTTTVDNILTGIARPAVPLQ